MEADSPVGMVPDHPQHPRRLPVLGRRHLQEGRRAVRRRADATRRRAHAAATLQYAAARRADQPSRSRLEGRAARCARGLRGHVDLRVARPVLRGQARDEDHRGRPRHDRDVSRDLRTVPVEPAGATDHRRAAPATKPTGRRPRPRPAAQRPKATANLSGASRQPPVEPRRATRSQTRPTGAGVGMPTSGSVGLPTSRPDRRARTDHQGA